MTVDKRPPGIATAFRNFDYEEEIARLKRSGGGGLVSDPSYRKGTGNVAQTSSGNGAALLANVAGMPALDLPAGTWRVHGYASTYANVADYVYMQLYNETDGAVIPGTYSAGSINNTVASLIFGEPQTAAVITLTKTTRLRLYLTPAGSSTITINSGFCTTMMEAWLVGPGPQGAKGDTGATGGNATVPIDPWHIVGTVGEPALQNGWSQGGSGFSQISFRRNPLGVVELRGTMTGGAMTQIAFTLPAGCRPATDLRLPMYTDGGVETMLYISSGGGVYPWLGGNTMVSLDGIQFDTGTVTQMPTGPQGAKGDPGAPNAALVWPPGLSTLNAQRDEFPGGYWPRYRRYMRNPAGQVSAQRLTLFEFTYDYTSWHSGGLIELTLTTDYYVGGGLRAILIYGWSQGPPGTTEGRVEIVSAYGPNFVAPKLAPSVPAFTSGQGAIDYPNARKAAQGFSALNQVIFDGTLATISDPGWAPVPSFSKPEPWRTIGAAGEPAFQNGWSGVTGNTPQFRKRNDGTCEMRGLVTGVNPNTTVFALPSGYQPSPIYMATPYAEFTSPGGYPSAIILLDNNVTLYGTGPGFTAWCSLAATWSVD
jgi:hypothetical protein